MKASDLSKAETAIEMARKRIKGAPHLAGDGSLDLKLLYASLAIKIELAKFDIEIEEPA